MIYLMPEIRFQLLFCKDFIVVYNMWIFFLLYKYCCIIWNWKEKLLDILSPLRG